MANKYMKKSSIAVIVTEKYLKPQRDYHPRPFIIQKIESKKNWQECVQQELCMHCKCDYK